MSTTESALLALRLFAVGALVLLAPGLALLRAMRIAPPLPERIVLGFALSYSWIFVLAIVVPLLGWPADRAGVLTVVLIAAALFVSWRRRHGRVRDPVGRAGAAPAAALVALLAALAAAGWLVEPPVTGEEVLDLAAIARFADGGPITFQNTSLLPDTTPVYIVQPYQLAVGLIARWTAADPLVALLKLRALLAPLALLCVFVLLRRLATSSLDAAAALVVVVLFVLLDTGTWENHSLFPVVRRGGVGAALCAPTLMVLVVLATRAALDGRARRVRRAAAIALPLMVLASLSTHPLEVFTFLWFGASVLVAALAGLDRTADRRSSLRAAAALAAATAAYLVVHAQAVPYVAEYERGDKQDLRDELRELAGDPVRAIAGGPTEARELLSRTVPATTAVVAGMPALVVAALRQPGAASILALATVPPALADATPVGFALIKLVTSPETARDVNAHFALLGLASLALALVTLAHVVLRAAASGQGTFARVVAASAAGSLVLWAGWTFVKAAVPWLAEQSRSAPELLLLVGVAATAGVVQIARRGRRLPGAPMFAGVVVLSAGLALPFAAPDWLLGGVFERRMPVPMWQRVAHGRAAPSVLDFQAYYEHTLAPQLLTSAIPFEVFEQLRRHVPPRQVVLADPLYSCELAVLLAGYCVNPVSIPGHYYQPAAPYFAAYVQHQDDRPPVHPLFNSDPALTDRERRFLHEYPIDYILVSPDRAETIARKVELARPDATLDLALAGHRLYRLSRR